MAAAQPAYDYSAYDYSYGSAPSAAYPSYPGYESTASYATPGTYEGYAASAAYHTGSSPGASYAAVDPYSGYPTTAYAAYQTTAASAAGPSQTAAQAAYASTYGASPSTAGYAYESRRTTPPSSAASSAAGHYATYDYSSGAAAAYATAPSSVAAYSYKTASATNGSSSSAYPTYATAAPVAAAPQHPGAYGVPSTMAPQPSHVYAPAPPPPGMMARRPEYYAAPQASHPMQFVHHQPQPQAMPFRLPPRGGYQRELDEPGDENALLRHVVFISGLPKEIQNETLAEVFGASCGQIAPVDVRSPKPKIWVYKDRQTREGKGEATITFVNAESAQTAIAYFNGKELFGREIRVTLCPRRMYNMQKQNTPFNAGAPPMNMSTPISVVKSTPISSSSSSSGTTTAASTTTINTSTTTTAAATSSSSSTATTTTTTTASSSSNLVSAANPIATISSSTLGLPRQLNHSLFKLRQTPEQQRGLLPTPPVHYGAPMMSSGGGQRDGVRKELPRIALTRGNYVNPAGIRPKPY